MYTFTLYSEKPTRRTVQVYGKVIRPHGLTLKEVYEGEWRQDFTKLNEAILAAKKVAGHTVMYGPKIVTIMITMKRDKELDAQFAFGTTSGCRLLTFLPVYSDKESMPTAAYKEIRQYTNSKERIIKVFSNKHTSKDKTTTTRRRKPAR